MDLPIYCVLEGRPVKVVEDEHGVVEVWLYDLKRRDFVRRGDLLARVLLQDEGVTELNEDEFAETLRRLGQKDARQAG